ncbi:hypothetical protein Cylst_5321 [Cylindrospermum stagnale PCC 7417]|uniref:Uncharacterized protein n=1 Tax=Cylindrospermum stagnale PCC 7417 TaxID=56107 RepID=K9X6T0_9NOST|nr:helix-turn-helix transcriptional regulator [Cylindrospermum stagnale]AFZ27347.1 hypothetical protein Cylst_5321 [Cylindrospermum stagnale PCC 7417]
MHEFYNEPQRHRGRRVWESFYISPNQLGVVINNSGVAETSGVSNGKVTVRDIPVIKEITGSLVKQMRTAKKMSQRDFANAVGMS